MRKILFASTAVALCAAYESGTASWKMDGDKIAVDDDGNPILIDGNGRETSVKTDTVPNLIRDTIRLREARTAADAELKKFEGIDPTLARKAIETVSNIDAKKLIDAGEVDKVRDEIKRDFTAQIEERDKAIAERDVRINNMLIDSVFKGSEFITQSVAMPRDFFEAAMRDRFKVEDGKVVAYHPNGDRVIKNGEPATPDEALEILVDKHPQKDAILRAPDARGSGNSGHGGNRGTGAVIRRSDFDAADPVKQGEYAAAMQKGELTITD